MLLQQIRPFLADIDTNIIHKVGDYVEREREHGIKNMFVQLTNWKGKS